MTAINDYGQVYWTFEDLDLEGALEDVIFLHDTFVKHWECARDLEQSRIYHEAILKYSDVIANIRWLIRKGVK